MHTHSQQFILNKVPESTSKNMFMALMVTIIKITRKQHKCSSIGKLDKLGITHTEWDIMQLFKITVMCFIQMDV